jgi:hypothetical protein
VLYFSARAAQEEIPMRLSVVLLIAILTSLVFVPALSTGETAPDAPRPDNAPALQVYNGPGGALPGGFTVRLDRPGPVELVAGRTERLVINDMRPDHPDVVRVAVHELSPVVDVVVERIEAGSNGRRAVVDLVAANAGVAVLALTVEAGGDEETFAWAVPVYASVNVQPVARLLGVGGGRGSRAAEDRTRATIRVEHLRVVQIRPGRLIAGDTTPTGAEPLATVVGAAVDRDPDDPPRATWTGEVAIPAGYAAAAILIDGVDDVGLPCTRRVVVGRFHYDAPPVPVSGGGTFWATLSGALDGKFDRLKDEQGKSDCIQANDPIGWQALGDSLKAAGVPDGDNGVSEGTIAAADGTTIAVRVVKSQASPAAPGERGINGEGIVTRPAKAGAGANGENGAHGSNGVTPGSDGGHGAHATAGGNGATGASGIGGNAGGDGESPSTFPNLQVTVPAKDCPYLLLVFAADGRAGGDGGPGGQGGPGGHGGDGGAGGHGGNGGNGADNFNPGGIGGDGGHGGHAGRGGNAGEGGAAGYGGAGGKGGNGADGQGVDLVNVEGKAYIVIFLGNGGKGGDGGAGGAGGQVGGDPGEPGAKGTPGAPGSPGLGAAEDGAAGNPGNDSAAGNEAGQGSAGSPGPVGYGGLGGAGARYSGPTFPCAVLDMPGSDGATGSPAP